MTAPRLAAGEYVAGKYMVRQHLREDGAISTHLAVDQAGREFVLKLYSPALAQRADVTAALQAIHGQVNALPPEMVVHVVDAGIDAQRGNALYTATERQPLQPLPKVSPETCGSVLRALSKTLGTAHGRGLFHGAIKPNNVLVDSATPRIVRLVDFGMNLVRAAVPTDAGFTHAAPWMSPEQIDGGPATGASDVFSIALTIFHALTGAPYWRMDRFQSEIKGQRTPASQRANELRAPIPQSLDAVFTRALSLAPQQRFATVSELSTAFDLALASAKPQAVKLSGPAAGSSLKSTQYAADPAPKPKGASTLKSTQYAADPKIEMAKAAPPQKPPSNFDTLPDGPPAAALVSRSGPPPVPASSQPPMGMPPAQPMQPQQPPWDAQAAAQAQPAPMAMAPAPSTSLAPPPPKSSKAPLIIILVLLVLGGGGAAGWYFFLRGEPPTKTADATKKSKSDDDDEKADKGDDDDDKSSKKKTKKDGVDESAKKGDDDESPSAGASGSASAAAAPSASNDSPSDGVEVTISCNPACDAITVDGKPLADPSSPAHLSPGSHTVVASKVGYKSANDTFTVKANTPVTRVYTLAMLPATNVAAPKPTCGKFLKKCE